MIQNKTELLQKLAEQSFDKKYYQLYEELKPGEKMTAVSKDFITEALNKTGLEWKFLPKDKIFTYRKEIAHGNAGLNLDYTFSKIEAILVYKINQEELGAPFPLLAHQVARLEDPTFSYTPPYPKLPYANAEDLHKILDFLLETLKTLTD